MKAIQLTAFGNFADGVRLNEVPDIGAPEREEIVLEVEATPVTGSDFMMMAGMYGYLPTLPGTLGIEGVGKVVAVGSDVKHVKVGDRTLIPLGTPAWTERVKTSASWLRPLPEADLSQLSMLGVNPATAYLLLTEVVALQAGDWIVQNAANSSCGRAIIAIAKTMGIRTINVVRRPELVDELTSLGGDVVLVDGTDLATRVAAATNKAPVSLAIDMIGDSGTVNLMATLAHGGTVCFYANASRKPFQGSVTNLVFNAITVKGFWLVEWFKTAKPETLVKMYDFLGKMLVSGKIAAPIAATFTFDQYQEALATAAKREGKVILTPS